MGAAVVAWIKRGGDLKIKEIDAGVAANNQLMTHLMAQTATLTTQLEAARTNWAEREQYHLNQEKECNEKIADLREKHHMALRELESKLEEKRETATLQLRTEILQMQEGFREEHKLRAALEAELREVRDDRESLKQTNAILYARIDELGKENDALKRGRRKED